jgi:hypothetical protein
LRRRRRAERVLARVRPLIEAAQGSASVWDLAQQYAALLADASAMPAEARQATATTTISEPALRPYRSWAHRALFLALLAEAGTDGLKILWRSELVVLLGMIAGTVSMAGVVIALVKQQQTDLRFPVRALTWVAAGFIGLQRMTSYIILVVMMQSQHVDTTQWGYIRALARLRPLETPWLLALLSISAGAAALFGAVGLLLLPRKPESA